MQVKLFTVISEKLQRHEHIMALLLFVIVAVGFFYQSIVYGKLPVPSDTLVGMYHPWRDAYAHTFTNGVPFKNFLITDPIRQQIPWRRQVIDAFQKNKVPLWDATTFSGSPLLGNIQSGALYPFNILFLILPFTVSWTILIMSQPFLAGLFLYLFLRHKNLGFLPSMFGGLVFSYSGFSIAWLTWGTIVSTLAWLPLILLAIEKIHITANKWPWRVILIISVVSSFFAGHIQIFFYCMCVVFIYSLWIYRKMSPLPIKIMHGIIPFVILLLTSPVWIRMVSFFPETSRLGGAQWNVEGFFIPIKHLIQFIAPDYFGNPTTLNYWGTWNYGEMVGYIGMAGILLALIGIRKETLFWTVTVCVALLFSIDSPISKLLYQWKIPFLSSIQPTRLLSIVCFGISVLSAYGMSYIQTDKRNKQILMSIFIVGCTIIGMWVSVSNPAMAGIKEIDLAVTKRNIILPTVLYFSITGVLLLFLVEIKKVQTVLRFIIPIFLIGFTVFDVFRFGWKFTPFTDEAYFFPETEIISMLKNQTKPFRVMASDDRVTPPNVLSYYNIESIAGYDPIHTIRYEEYIAAMERGEPNIKPPFGLDRIIAPKTIASPLLPLLNVKYIISIDEIDNPLTKKIAEEGTTKVYKYVNFTPRVYFAENVMLQSSKEEVIRALYADTFIPGKTAVVEQTIEVLNAPLAIDESADIIKYENDRIEIRTVSKTQRLLVIGNSMDPYWTVTIDARETQIYRVNYLFMGVVVPTGAHTIKVQYK